MLLTYLLGWGGVLSLVFLKMIRVMKGGHDSTLVIETLQSTLESCFTLLVNTDFAVGRHPRLLFLLAQSLTIFLSHGHLELRPNIL